MAISHQRRQGDGTVDGQILEAVKKGSKSELYKEADEFYSYKTPVVKEFAFDTTGVKALLPKAYGRYQFSVQALNAGDEKNLSLYFKKSGTIIKIISIDFGVGTRYSSPFELIGVFDEVDVVADGDGNVSFNFNATFHGYGVELLNWQFNWVNTEIEPNAGMRIVHAPNWNTIEVVDFETGGSHWFETEVTDYLFITNMTPNSIMSFKYDLKSGVTNNQDAYYNGIIVVELATVKTSVAGDLKFTKVVEP